MLASIPFPSLKRFSITDSGITDEIAAILSRWEIPKLVVTSVGDNPLSSKGIKHLFSERRTPLLT